MNNMLRLAAILLVAAGCSGNPESHSGGKADHMDSTFPNDASETYFQAAKGDLVHIVFLKLNESVTEQQKEMIFMEIKKLGSIPSVKGIVAGTKANTGDPRFISDHDIVFEVLVSTMEDLNVYMTDSTHLAFREMMRPYLAEPALVFDYEAD